MKHFRWILPLLVAVLLYADLQASKQGPKVEKPKSYKGLVAALAIDKEKYKSGEIMKATITFTTNTKSHRLFNPFFHSAMLTNPGRIIIRDSDGKMVRRLFGLTRGSLRMAVEADYVLVHPKSPVSGKLTIDPSRGVIEDWAQVKPLRPGKYSVQLILLGSLLSLKGKDASIVIATSERLPFQIVL